MWAEVCKTSDESFSRPVMVSVSQCADVSLSISVSACQTNGLHANKGKSNIILRWRRGSARLSQRSPSQVTVYSVIAEPRQMSCRPTEDAAEAEGTEDLDELQRFIESRGHNLAPGWAAKVCRRSADPAKTMGCFRSPEGKRYRTFASVYSLVCHVASN